MFPNILWAYTKMLVVCTCFTAYRQNYLRAYTLIMTS